MILALFALVAVVNNDIRPASDIKHAAIVKLRSARLLPAEDMEAEASAAPKSWSRSIMAGLDLGPTSRGENVTLSAVIQARYQL